MLSSSQLAKQLAADYPQLHFAPGEQDWWDSHSQTVFYHTTPAALLHELGHALLGHTSYRRDVELLAMEQAAWHKARQLAPHYHVTITTDTVEDHLDTYRDWLHAKSTCPRCHVNGAEVAPHTYLCLACGQRWRTNSAINSRVQRRLVP